MSARRIIIYLSVFLLASGVVYLGLPYIFPKPTAPQKPIFLKVVGFWEPGIFNSLKKQFQEKNPEITIEYEKRSSENYFQNLAADLKTNNTPDVFWWHSGWGPELRDSLAKLPETVMSTTEFEKTFYPITQQASKVRGSYRGFPLEIDGLALLYNKDIFASKNFPNVPTSWPTLRQDYAPSLTVGDSKRILNSAIALGSENNVENVAEIITLFLMQNGVQFTNSNNELTIANNIDVKGNNLAADAINFFYYFSKTAKTWDNTQPNSIEAFANSKTAMILLPSYKIHNLLATVKNENLKLNFGVQPVPQLPDRPPVTYGSYWSLGVSEKSQQKTAAWKFAKFMTEEDSLRTVFKLESAKNDFGSPYPRVSMAREQTTNSYLSAYITQAPQAKTWYLNSDTADSGLNDQLVSELKNAMLQIENNTNTDTALKSLIDKINPILQKYGLITGIATPVQK